MPHWPAFDKEIDITGYPGKPLVVSGATEYGEAGWMAVWLVQVKNDQVTAAAFGYGKPRVTKLAADKLDPAFPEITYGWSMLLGPPERSEDDPVDPAQMAFDVSETAVGFAVEEPTGNPVRGWFQDKITLTQGAAVPAGAVVDGS
jgi:hypothetical protein